MRTRPCSTSRCALAIATSPWPVSSKRRRASPSSFSALGALDVAFTEEDERALTARTDWQRGHRLPVETLTAEEIRQAEPNVNPAVRKGALIAGDRRLDNVRLVRALAASAVARGASLLCGRPVTAPQSRAAAWPACAQGRKSCARPSS